MGPVAPDSEKDKRPFAERGFEAIKPVSTYANQSDQLRLKPIYDKTQGYPKRQPASKDSNASR